MFGVGFDDRTWSEQVEFSPCGTSPLSVTRITTQKRINTPTITLYFKCDGRFVGPVVIKDVRERLTQ